MNKTLEEIKEFTNNFVGWNSRFGLHISDGVDSCSGTSDEEEQKAKECLIEFIESTISQTKQELIEEIYTSGIIADGMYDPRRVVAYVDKLHREVLKTI